VQPAAIDAGVTDGQDAIDAEAADSIVQADGGHNRRNSRRSDHNRGRVLRWKLEIGARTQSWRSVSDSANRADDSATRITEAVTGISSTESFEARSQGGLFFCPSRRDGDEHIEKRCSHTKYEWNQGTNRYLKRFCVGLGQRRNLNDRL
jgi:hypothetical protein